MNPSTEARLEKVKRMSRSARRMCFLLMGFLALAALVQLAAGALTTPEKLTCEIGGVRQACSELPPAAATFAVIGVIGSVALVLAGLYRLSRLFSHYSRGEIFTRGSVRELRLLGYLTGAFAIFQMVMFIAMLALAANDGTHWPVELRADLPLGPLVLAFFLLLFSWIMDVGAELREENELTV